MNRSTLPVAEVATGVVTVTSTLLVPGGATAVTSVSETTLKLAAATVPKLTPVAPLNPVPEMVAEVPPATSPEDGLTPVTIGLGVVVVMTWIRARCGGGVGEQVNAARGRGGDRGGDGDVDAAGAGRGNGGDVGVRDHAEAGGGDGAEADPGGAAEPGAGDGGRGAAGDVTRGRADPGDDRAGGRAVDLLSERARNGARIGGVTGVVGHDVVGSGDRIGLVACRLSKAIEGRCLTRGDRRSVVGKRDGPVVVRRTYRGRIDHLLPRRGRVGRRGDTHRR